MNNNNKKGRRDLQTDKSRKPSRRGSVLCVPYEAGRWGSGGAGGVGGAAAVAVVVVVVVLVVPPLPLSLWLWWWRQRC